jgi:hypothetical protein
MALVQWWSGESSFLGSWINNKIGASACARKPIDITKNFLKTFELDNRKACLGPMTDFTVYSGELYGNLMAIQMTLADFVRHNHWIGLA